MLCRLGLDGFAALLRTSDLAGAVRMTERAREMIAKINFQHGVEKEYASVSVGVIKVIVEENTTVESLLEDADGYLAKAQRSGGNKVSYNKPMADAAAAAEMSVDQALEMIANGKPEQVLSQIDGLMSRILPLLGLYTTVNVQGIKRLIAKLQEAIK